MNQEQIAEKLKAISQDKVYKGGLSAYAIQSIKSGRSNYPVSNLIAYCQDLGLKFVMTDLTTEDCFYPISVLDVHKVLDLLMNRYEVDNKLVYRKTAVHYTAPKSLVEEELEKIKATSGTNKYVASLSIKTLLAVCEVIHCDLSFIN
jgi:transcriptional regulator with XRE-family HTH domain